MSFVSSNYRGDPNNPQDPLYYAPRSVRGMADARILQTRPEELPTPSLSRLDETSENAVVKSIGPLKCPDYERQPLRLLATAGGIAAAIVIAAIVALFLYHVFAKSDRPPSERTVAVSTPASAAPVQVEHDDSRALLQGFERFKKMQGPTTPSAATAKEEPEKPTALLEKFIQWEQRN
jgi:hypothetical protein